MTRFKHDAVDFGLMDKAREMARKMVCPETDLRARIQSPTVPGLPCIDLIAYPAQHGQLDTPGPGTALDVAEPLAIILYHAMSEAADVEVEPDWDECPRCAEREDDDEYGEERRVA